MERDAMVKITAPKDPGEYLQQTEHAVKHAYAGLDSCWQHYREARQYWDVSQIDQPMTTERREALDRSLEQARKYFELTFSEAMFAGSILQAAYMAIKLYSRNTAIPANCTALVPPSRESAIPYCIGKERHGVPIGLIVYAGRNQYNHWDDEEPHDVTIKVFGALSGAFSNNILYDLAFELSNPTINIYANEILLGALGWTKYATYMAEMRSLLAEAVG